MEGQDQGPRLRAVPALQLTVTSHGTGKRISFASSSEKGNPKILLLGFEGAFGSNFERSAIPFSLITGCKLNCFHKRVKLITQLNLWVLYFFRSTANEHLLPYNNNVIFCSMFFL